MSIHPDHEEGLTFVDILKFLPGHVYWKDCKGVFLGCNDQQAKLFGQNSAQDLIGKTDYDFLPKEMADEIVRNDRKIIETGVSKMVEERTLLPNGEVAVYLSKKAPINNSKGEIIGILGISFNITAEKKRQNRQQNLLDSILAKMPGHVYWKDCEGRFLGCNDQQARTAGFASRNDMLGKTDAEMPWKEQAEYLRKIDKNVMQSGEEKTINEDFLLPDGTKKLFLSKKIPLYDNEGQVFGILGVSFDITKESQLERELQLTKESEARFKAMSALGGMIAHELRTPLTGLGLAAHTIEKLLPQLIEGYEKSVADGKAKPIHANRLAALKVSVSNMQRSVSYAQATVRTILTGFHYGDTDAEIEVVSFSLKQMVNKALSQYPFDRHEESLYSIKHLDDVLVLGEEQMVMHVIDNLLKNALHIIHAEGRGTITLWSELSKNTVDLCVEDSAKGIAPEQVDHIFEAFYTTKKKEAASIGLGLYFCKAVLEKMNANINCESEFGKYTRFRITLPLYKQ